MRTLTILVLLLLYYGVWGQSENVTETLVFKEDGIVCLGLPNVQLSKLKYFLYKRETPQGIRIDDQNYDEVKSDKRVVFVIHGWVQSTNEPWVSIMKDKYLNNWDINVIALDWSEYAGINYIRAYCAVQSIGLLTGELITNLTNSAGIDLKKVQINGVSLGAHIAGYAGQRVQELNNGAKIGRINGLDAAMEGFLGLLPRWRLDESDADFVQGIHTSDFKYGYPLPYATVDFEINYSLVTGCGSSQKGCPLYPGVPAGESSFPYLFCDHFRAISYFVESIDTNQFLGVPCLGCPLFATGFCRRRTPTVMGEHCPSDARGVKYLVTNNNVPFARGSGGTSALP